MIKLQPNKKFPVTNTQFFGCLITLTLAIPSEGSLHNPNSDSTDEVCSVWGQQGSRTRAGASPFERADADTTECLPCWTAGLHKQAVTTLPSR